MKCATNSNNTMTWSSNSVVFTQNVNLLSSLLWTIIIMVKLMSYNIVRGFLDTPLLATRIYMVLYLLNYLCPGWYICLQLKLTTKTICQRLIKVPYNTASLLCVLFCLFASSFYSQVLLLSTENCPCRLQLLFHVLNLGVHDLDENNQSPPREKQGMSLFTQLRE